MLAAMAMGCALLLSRKRGLSQASRLFLLLSLPSLEEGESPVVCEREGGDRGCGWQREERESKAKAEEEEVVVLMFTISQREEATSKQQGGGEKRRRGL